MKKLILMVVAVLAMAGSAMAFDGSLSGEYKMYGDAGYRSFEGILNAGQAYGKFRPFGEIKYNADNAGLNGTYQHLNAEYKLGLGTTLFPNLNIEGGVLFNQNLQAKTRDDRALFAKVTYTFDLKSKKK